MRDFWLFYGSAPPAAQGFGGRAVVRPGNGAIFAGFFKFKPDEPVRGDNLARSLFVQPKHAQNKFCGLTAVIPARIRRCRDFGIPDLIVYP
ncbi:MAG: hypothetical protein IIU08_07515, partial [Clostridia bacterium]|nr:hypothetical protein [Clostridia bacterium]